MPSDTDLDALIREAVHAWIRNDASVAVQMTMDKQRCDALVARLDAALRARLAELRARAEKAERELAECRNKTIDECAALVDRWDAPENAANLIRKLKTKEPT